MPMTKRRGERVSSHGGQRERERGRKGGCDVHGPINFEILTTLQHPAVPPPSSR